MLTTLRKTLRKDWHEFHSALPGNRFQHRYHQKKHSGGSSIGTYVMLGIGVLLFGAGIVFIIAPGPGITMVLVGGALMAQGSLRVARLMDRGEIGVRARLHRFAAFWQRASLLPRAAIGTAAALVFAAIGLASYRIVFSA